MNYSQGLNGVDAPIREATDAESFLQAVKKGDQPVVLRKGVAHWAVVKGASNGPGSVARYLQSRDTGLPVYTIVGQPEIRGQFGFTPDFCGLNYQARQTPISTVLPYFESAHSRGVAIAVQAAPAIDVLRNWQQENPNSLVPDRVQPTLWLSTPSRVAPHSDIHDNLACVAAGRRRFTVFPPEQLKNIYLGPLLDSPGGVPVSTVDAWAPNFNQHPGFSHALDSALSSTLGPGDAVFIPALWWHAVESLEPFNLLVNYWWGGDGTGGISPYDALTHASLAISALSLEKRTRWKHYFEALVFRTEQAPGDHLPEDLKDLITSPSNEQARTLLKKLSEVLGSVK